MPIDSIAIIPDGTRRWSKREGLTLLDGYHHAFDNLLIHIDALEKRGVKDIHLYLFSIYNLRRAIEEIQACLDAECVFIENLTKRKYRLAISGDIDAISQVHKRIANAAKNIHAYLPSNETPVIHLYIGYSFHHHVESILRSGISQSSILSALTEPKLDLVIRTGDALTLSDFLPIESRYAQIYFLPILFNDLSVPQLMELCDKFDQGRFGLKYGE